MAGGQCPRGRSGQPRGSFPSRRLSAGGSEVCGGIFFFALLSRKHPLINKAMTLEWRLPVEWALTRPLQSGVR